MVLTKAKRKSPSPAKDTRPDYIRHYEIFKNFVRATVPEPEQEAVATLAGKPEAGTITPVQMARPPHNFTPSQIAFHIIDRSFGKFRTLDYADLNFLLVCMCASMSCLKDGSPITPNTKKTICLKLAKA